jgi:gliding motility-associated-like protein
VNPTAPCAIAATATVTVTEEVAPDPGTNGTITFCGNDASSDLFVELGSSANAGGVWSPVLTSGSGIFNPAIDAAGTYTYSITTSCGIFGADVIVSVNTILTTVQDSSICSGTDYTFPNGTVHSNINIDETYTSTLTSINTGCDSLVVTNITVISLPTATISGGNSYCIGDVAADILVTVTGSANWTLDYDLNGTATTVTGSVSPFNLGSASGTYTLSVITDNACSNAALIGSETISINPIPSAPNASGDSTYCSTWTFLPMNASGIVGASFTWYDMNGTVLSNSSTLQPENTLGVTEYYVTQSLLGCESPADSVVITIKECDIVIPTAFTPDGDGVNDDWNLINLDALYPENVVTIYNRWGNVVFEHNSASDGIYDSNRWNGEFNGSELPVASYYFIIKLDDIEELRTGIVTIIK